MPIEPSVLFVCLGNICRSPLAEAALRAEAQKLGLAVEVDSAGTGGWHVGEPPDGRAIETARAHGADISGTRARKIQPADFRRFTHVVALDTDNFDRLLATRPHDSTAEISLLLDHVPGRRGQGVADPYYGDLAAFETTWTDVQQGDGCAGGQVAEMRSGWRRKAPGCSAPASLPRKHCMAAICRRSCCLSCTMAAACVVKSGPAPRIEAAMLGGAERRRGEGAARCSPLTKPPWPWTTSRRSEGSAAPGPISAPS